MLTFTVVNLLEDCERLKRNIDFIWTWCSSNDLLYESNTKVISFSRKRVVFSFSCALHATAITRVKIISAI